MHVHVCWVADKVQKSHRQHRRGKQHQGTLKLPCVHFLFLLLPPLQLRRPLLLLPPQPLQVQLPSVLQPPFFSQPQMPLQPPLLLQTKPLLLCFDASGRTKIPSHRLRFIPGLPPDMSSRDQDHDTEPHNRKRIIVQSPCGPFQVLPVLLVLFHLPPLNIHAHAAVHQEMSQMLQRRKHGVTQLHRSAQGFDERSVLATCFFWSSSDSVRGQSSLGELAQDWKLGSEARWECVLESRSVSPGGLKKKEEANKVSNLSPA